SFLAARAVKGAAVSDRHAFYRSAARAALLPLAIVDPEMLLKVAILVVGVAIIGKRCAAPADRLAQNLRRSFRDTFNLGAAELPRPRSRPHAGVKKDFVGVDVAETGDGRLIDQQIAD